MTPSNTTRPRRLRSGFAIIRMADGVQLRAGDEEIHVIETGEADLIEGWLQRLSRGEQHRVIAASIPPDDRPLLDKLIEQLAQQNLLTEATTNDESDIRRYLSHFERNEWTRVQDVDVECVNVIGQGESARLLVDALVEHGLAANLYETQSASSAGDGAVATRSVFACIWERPQLKQTREFNAAACARRLPCLFVDLSHGRHATVGPFFVPGEGACYQCFRDRLRQNTAALPELDAAEAAMLDAKTDFPAYGTLPAFRYQVVGLACAELFAFATRHRPLRTLCRALTVDFEAMTMWSEPVWRIPWCTACGQPSC